MKHHIFIKLMLGLHEIFYFKSHSPFQHSEDLKYKTTEMEVRNLNIRNVKKFKLLSEKDF